jgi:phage gp46-like protein
MFDIATRPSPSGRLPFDWQLLTPLSDAAYPWTSFDAADGVPVVHAQVLKTYALRLEPTLQTAVALSLFTDRRADADDKLPQGATDRRGWAGEAFVGDGQPWGSHLWLLAYGKADEDKPARARFACTEALAWMVDSGLATKVTADAEWVAGTNSERLAVRPQIWQGSSALPVYDVLWATSVQRGVQG